MEETNSNVQHVDTGITICRYTFWNFSTAPPSRNEKDLKNVLAVVCGFRIGEYCLLEFLYKVKL